MIVEYWRNRRSMPQKLPGMRMIGERLRSSGNPTSGSGVYEEHGLFLFPNTDAGWLATVERLSAASLKHA